MSTDELRTAHERLLDARQKATGTAATRLDTLCAQVSNAVDDGRHLDHGQLARMMNTLAELREDEAGDAAEAISTARHALATYREGIEGV